MSDINISTGNRYKFTTINGSVLGTSYSAICIGDNLTYQAAKLYDPNVDNKQAYLIPDLPQSVSTKHTGYKYLLFQTDTGAVIVLADVWINKESVVLYSSKSVEIRIEGADSSDVSRIKAILGLAGFLNVKEIS